MEKRAHHRSIKSVNVWNVDQFHLHPHDTIVGLDYFHRGPPAFIVERRPPFQSRINKKRK